MPMVSAVVGRLTARRPGHPPSAGRRFTNEEKQPETISKECGPPQTSKVSSPEGNSPKDSPSHSNGLWFIPDALTRSSLVLENSGNLARDHLAIERTWLSYMRTGLSITWTAVAVVQCFSLITADPMNPPQTKDTRFFGLNAISPRFARPIGLAMILLALCVIAIGVHRYFKVQKAVMQGVFPATRFTVVLLSSALATLVMVTLGVFLTLS